MAEVTTPPAPAPAPAETLEQQNVFADIGLAHPEIHLHWSNKLIAMTQERDDALRRLQSTERERFKEDHWFAEASKQAQRAEAAEQKVRDIEQALRKVDEIRHDIVNRQKLGWSAHVYPLVAALEAAGYRYQQLEPTKATARAVCRNCTFSKDACEACRKRGCIACCPECDHRPVEQASQASLEPPTWRCAECGHPPHGSTCLAGHADEAACKCSGEADTVCRHGAAADVACADCHSGFAPPEPLK